MTPRSHCLRQTHRKRLIVERLEDRLAPAVFDTFNGGAASFNSLFATNYNGVPGGTNFNWNATAGIDDQGGSPGGGISAAQNTPLNDETAIYTPTAINLADGAVHTVSMFVTAAVGADSGDRILNIGFINSPTGAFNNGFSYLSAKLFADHAAAFSFDNGPGHDAVLNDVTHPAAGTIADNDWLQLVLTAQEIASNKFFCTYSLFDYGQTGTAAPTQVIAPVTHTATTLSSLGNATTMYTGFRYGMSGNATSPLTYDNFSLDASIPNAPAAKLAILTQPTSGTTGQTLSPLNIAIEDSSSNVLFSDSSTVTLTLNHGTFANGQTTVSVQTVNGIATFGNLQINAPGSYTLQATDSNSSVAPVATPLTISAGAASRVIFVQQPSDAAVGTTISPAVTVAVTDAGSNTITGDSSAVTLTLSSGTFAGGSSMVTANAVGGVASFSGLVINGAGTYTLTASDGSLTGATSGSFAVTVGTVYVSGSNFGLATPPSPGQGVDGDQGTAGTQSAIFGATAFDTIGAALAAVGSSGTVVVNAGTYAESPALAGGKLLQLSGNVTIASLDSAPGTTVDLQANTLTTGNFAGNDTIAGSIIGSGGLVKIASDTLTLSGVDSFTGGATLSAGTLIVNGSLASSAVSVASVATLGGRGTVGAVLSNGGTINPGDSAGPGTLTVTGAMTLGSGSVVFDLAGIASYDRVNVTGTTVTIAGTTLSLVIGTINDNEVYTILAVSGTSTSSLIGTFNGLPTNGSAINVGSRTFVINYAGGDGNDITLTAAAAGSLTLSATDLNGGTPYVDNASFSHQHSMVESVAYTFSGPVSLTSSDFTIAGINGTTAVPSLNVNGSAGNTVWTVTFSGAGSTAGSIDDGEYNLHLGHGYNSDFSFYRLLGDFDNSHTVDFNDFLNFNTTFNRATNDPLYTGAADFDGSGQSTANTVDFNDFLTFNSNFNHSVPTPYPAN